MSQFLDRLERVRGLPVMIGVLLVIANLIVRSGIYFLVPPDQPLNFFLFLLADGNLLLHLGVIFGLLGILIGDIL
jgi:hypothetical protein